MHGAAHARALTILYGTETGNSAALARAAADQARGVGLEAVAVDMGEYKTRRLRDEQDLLIIVSTYGEGDPPQPAADFFEFVEGRKAPSLTGVRFAVLALGDSTYEKFCEAGKRLDRRFEELGAARLMARVDCDVDYDEAAAVWTADALALLARDRARTAEQADASVPLAAGATAARVRQEDSVPGEDHRQFRADRARVEQGDAARRNFARRVGAAASSRAMRSASRRATIPSLSRRSSAVSALTPRAPLKLKGSRTPLAEALEEKFDITAATPRFVEQWANLSAARGLKKLLGDDNARERTAYLRDHHVIDIIREFPVPGVLAEAFVAGLRPLQPRLYSIASSLAANPDEAHLTVSTVRYELHGEPRAGVASGYFAERAKPDTTLPVYIQSNPHFRAAGR